MRNEPTRLNGTYTEIYNWQSPTDASLCVYYKKAKGKAKGVIQINHGLAEHGGRYARFAEALSTAGYHVYAHDHRGHGASMAPNASQGVFALENGADKVLQDVKFVITKIKSTHPNLPLIMFGHSMGAMITYNYLLRWPEDIDACAIWNAAMSKGGTNGLLKFILGFEGKFKKPDADSVIDKLTFKTFNKKFKPNQTECDWLSKDVDECRAYDDDPDCGWPASVSMWKDLLAWVLRGASDEGLENVPKDMPIYLLGGAADPSTMDAKATLDMQSRMRAAGLTNIKTWIRKNGRHEALNEPKAERETVVAVFVDWVEGITNVAETIPSEIVEPDPPEHDPFNDPDIKTHPHVPKLMTAETIPSEIEEPDPSERDPLTDPDIYAHPRARELMVEDFFWDCVDEGAPFGSDEGWDAYYGWRDWREKNKSKNLLDAMSWILSDQLDEYNENLCSDAQVKKDIADPDNAFMATSYNMFTLDTTIIAIALGQLIDEGKIDEKAKPYVNVAITRKLHPDMCHSDEGEVIMLAVQRVVKEA